VLFFSPILAIILLVLYGMGGAAIGVLSGWIVSLVTKCGPRGIGWDALLGFVGFVVGFIGTGLMPWHQNTITYQLDGGGTSTSTANTYQYPERVAVVVAILLPLLFELCRFWRRRTKPR
jgi:MFS family permease